MKYAFLLDKRSSTRYLILNKFNILYEVVNLAFIDRICQEIIALFSKFSDPIYKVFVSYTFFSFSIVIAPQTLHNLLDGFPILPHATNDSI